MTNITNVNRKATTNTTIGFPEIDIVVRKRGENEAKRRLVAKLGVAEAYRLLGAYNSITKAGVKGDKANNIWNKVLEVMEMPKPEAPKKGEGNCVFLKPFDWFVTKEGEVIPPGLTWNYCYEGDDYSVAKTPREKAVNIVLCYKNTDKELQKKFNGTVTGYFYEDPIKAGVTPREYFRNEAIWRELRRTGEFVEKEYDPLWEVKNYLYETKGFVPYSGDKDLESQTELDKAEALLKAQKADYELGFWGDRVLMAVKEIILRAKEHPLEAIELTKLVAESLKDMTDTNVHQKRCSEYLEDTHCDNESYETELEKRAIKIAPKEREFRWALKRELSKSAREVGADKYLRWLNKWAPTEMAKKVDVKKESFKVARAIGYKEACDLYFQKTFGDAWERELKIFLEFNPEGRNAYLASAKVCELISKFETKRCFKYALQTALQDSTYDVFIDAYENFLHKELDLTIIHNWLRSTKLEKYDNTLSKVELAYRDAKIISLEQNSLIISSDLDKLEDMKAQGCLVNENVILSLQNQLSNLSKLIEDLRDANEKEEEEA